MLPSSTVFLTFSLFMNIHNLFSTLFETIISLIIFMFDKVFAYLQNRSADILLFWRDCLTRWIWLLMTCMVSSRINRGRGQFFFCSNDFVTQIVFFSRYKIIGTHKKLKKWHRPQFRLKTNHTFHQKPNPSCEIVPLMSVYLLLRLQYPGHNFTYVAVHVTRKDISHSKHIQVYHSTMGIEPLPRVFGKFVQDIQNARQKE